MYISIEIIAHDRQRYSTPGDWFFDDKGDLHIKVSKLSDGRFEQLIAIHELVEVLLCKQAGVTQEAVDKFDKDYESNRKPGDVSEPGDQLAAPYFRQHLVATFIERIMAGELDVDWEKYAKEVESL